MSFNIARQSFGLTITISSLLLLLFFWSRTWVMDGGLYSDTNTQFATDTFSNAAMMMPISEYIYSHFLNIPQILRQFAIAILVFINGVLITRIVTRNMVVTERTYVPIIICVIISCGLFAGDSIIIPILASSFFIYAFDMILRSFKRIPEYSLVFNGALYIGLAILLYPPTAIFIPILPIAMVILRKNGREWIIALAGLSLPILLCSYIYWGIGEDFSYSIRSIVEILSQISIRTDYASMLQQPQQIVFGFTVAVISVCSLIKFIKNGSRTRTRPYKTYLMATWSLVLAGIVTLVLSSGIYATPLLALPLAIIIPYYFSSAKGWFANLLYTLLLSSVVVCNLMQL